MRSEVRLHPARAAQGSSAAIHGLRRVSLSGAILDDVGVEPVCQLRDSGGSNHPIQLGRCKRLWLQDEDRKEPGIEVAGLPQRQPQVVIALDLRRHFADVTEANAELVVIRAILPVLRAHSFVTERFEPRECVFESHGRVGAVLRDEATALARDRVQDQPDQPANDGAVDPDELKITTDRELDPLRCRGRIPSRAPCSRSAHSLPIGTAPRG